MFGRRYTTVGQLIETLSKMDKDSIIVTEGNDHNYQDTSPSFLEWFAVCDKNKDLYEFYDDDHLGDDKKISVVIVR